MFIPLHTSWVCVQWNEGEKTLWRQQGRAVACLQKMAFRNMKGHLLNAKRPSFALQKTAFCKSLKINLIEN